MSNIRKTTLNNESLQKNAHRFDNSSLKYVAAPAAVLIGA